MTTQAELLDRLASDAPWNEDWPDVLRRVDSAVGRRRGPRPARRLTAATLVIAAVLAPLALAAANGWWVFRAGGSGTVVRRLEVVEQASWSGRPWQLIAGRTPAGHCFALAPVPARSFALTCASIVGASSPAAATIASRTEPATTRLPANIAGPVVATASEIEIQLADGQALRVATFPAPASLGRIRFYAAPLPAKEQPQKIIGRDSAGNVVACLVPATTVAGSSPLSDCR
jgi:hypothetical protein